MGEVANSIQMRIEKNIYLLCHCLSLDLECFILGAPQFKLVKKCKRKF